MTNDIIPIPLRRTLISGIEIETVDARDIHAYLEVGKDYTTWVTSRIEQYGFEGGLDFVRISAETGENPTQESCSPKRGSKISSHGGHNRTEYFVTIGMAKELAMVERNEKGKKARKYFIACEQRLRDVSRQISGEPSLTPEIVGGVVKGVFKKAIASMAAELLPAMIEAHLMKDHRVAVGEYVAALAVCIDNGVPPRKRRGFVNRVSHRLRGFCALRGISCRRDVWRLVWVFPVSAVTEWLKIEGKAIIADHCAAMAGQGVIQFPSGGKRSK